MTVVRRIGLTDSDHPWRPAAMPTANAPIDAVALASPTAPFAILGRFPHGFVRNTPGGYAATEEFVVLEGALLLDGVDVGPGEFVHIGARRLRTSLAAPQGCLVLAWFDAPPRFIAAPDLDHDPAAPLVVHHLDDLRRRTTALETSVARWFHGPASDWPDDADGFDDATWAASARDWPVRRRRDQVVWRQRRYRTDMEG